MPSDLPEGITTGVYPEEAEALAELARGQRVLEFGTWHGFSTIVMARVASQVVTVDWHHGDEHAGPQETLPFYLANLTRYGLRDEATGKPVGDGDRVITIIGHFAQVAPYLRTDRFTFGFLDGQHDYASTYRDLDLMGSLLPTGSRMAVHDYARFLGDVPFEVTPAVHDWQAANPEWHSVSLVESLYIMERA